MSTVTCEDRALILGGADCVWDDVLAWEEMYGRQWDGLVIAANDIGAHWPRALHHWVTLHPNKLERWLTIRRKNQLSCEDIQTWGREVRRHRPMTDHVLKPWSGGSSGMLAVQVAKELGCRRAVLCGIPMTPTGHFSETGERFGSQWAQAAGHWKAWLRCKDRMDGWVRSMGGRSQELLGVASLDWLEAEGARLTGSGLVPFLIPRQ